MGNEGLRSLGVRLSSGRLFDRGGPKMPRRDFSDQILHLPERETIGKSMGKPAMIKIGAPAHDF
jgi:hypothetical protein